MKSREKILGLAVALSAIGLVALSVWSSSSSPERTLASSYSGQPQKSLSSVHSESPLVDGPKTRQTQAEDNQNGPFSRMPVTSAMPASASVPVPGSASEAATMSESSPDPVATVKTGNKVYPHQVPNQIGVFPQIQIEPSAKVNVSLTYPEAAPGDVVALQVQDGGHLEVNGKSVMAQAVVVDFQKNVAFDFQATQQLGIYRIALRDGANVHVVNLWAGNPQVVRQ